MHPFTPRLTKTQIKFLIAGIHLFVSLSYCALRRLPQTRRQHVHRTVAQALVQASVHAGFIYDTICLASLLHDNSIRSRFDKTI